MSFTPGPHSLLAFGVFWASEIFIGWEEEPSSVVRGTHLSLMFHIKQPTNTDLLCPIVPYSLYYFCMGYAIGRGRTDSKGRSSFICCSTCWADETVFSHHYPLIDVVTINLIIDNSLSRMLIAKRKSVPKYTDPVNCQSLAPGYLVV